MFSVAKLKKIDNERITIEVINLEINSKYNKNEIIKTLAFYISGDDYSFNFLLNCKPQKLLDIPLNEKIDFKKYILANSTEFNVQGVTILEPKINIKLTRYLKNNYLISLTFFTDFGYSFDSYSGMIEFEFDLDKYMDNII